MLQQYCHELVERASGLQPEHDTRISRRQHEVNLRRRHARASRPRTPRIHVVAVSRRGDDTASHFGDVAIEIGGTFCLTLMIPPFLTPSNLANASSI